MWPIAGSKQARRSRRGTDGGIDSILSLRGTMALSRNAQAARDAAAHGFCFHQCSSR
jgi:hypothetical protein